MAPGLSFPDRGLPSVRPMIELLREPDLIRIGPLRQMLEREGIRTFVRNENLAMVEAPIPVFQPALCIVEEGDYERAVALIREFEQPVGDPSEEVRCPACGETSPGTFAHCWNCNGELPGGAAPH